MVVIHLNYIYSYPTKAATPLYTLQHLFLHWFF